MRLSKKAKSVLITTIVAITAVLSWIGFAKLYPEGNNPEVLPERIFRTVKALSGDPIGSAVENKNLPWELILAKILATIILIAGVFKIIKSVFFEYFTMFKIVLKNRHTIIVGTNKKGSRILQDLKNCQKETAVTIEQNEDNPNIDKLRNDGHLVVFGDAKDAEILKEAGIKKAKNFICFLNDEQSGLEVAKSIYDLYSKEKIENTLEVFLHLENPRLLEMMQESKILKSKNNSLEFRFFNTNRMIARNFFQKFPWEYQSEIQQNKKFRLLIFGLTKTGEQLILQALRVLHFPKNNVAEIVVIDENIDSKSKIFNEKYPKINKISELRFREFDGTFQSVLNEFKPENNIENVLILCFDDDKENLSSALEILNKTPVENFKIFAQNNNSKGMNLLFDTEKQTRIKFFGNLDYVCKMELITREKQDTLAKAIHNDYLALQKELAESESTAYKTPWEALSEDAKNANRAQADHIIYKLATLGKDLKNLKNLQISPEETELLAKTEHERWNAHRYTNGWDFGEKRDDLQKLHPSLISWEDLPEGEKQKDRDTVLRLGKILEKVDSLEF